jgi:3-methyl-2-oxobutanoate hydroxymethyltransferase
MNSTKWTASRIKALKRHEKVVCLTAYDWFTARLVDEAGIHLILVGDSLGMTVLGYKTTLPVTMAEMLHHVGAVARGVQSAMVIADMPFMSFQVSSAQAMENAGRFVKEAGADGVKIEGGENRVATIRAIVENGIPVMGHIGLTPQSIKAIGGYKVQGRKSGEAKRLIRDAKAVAAAGVFCIVLECVPRDLGAEVTKAVEVPVIGIGAGPACDGQILVTPDLLGLYGEHTPKFAKQYVDLGARMRQAFRAYKQDVASGAFPGNEHCY